LPKYKIVRVLFLKPIECSGLRTNGELAVSGKFMENERAKSGQKASRLFKHEGMRV
jgi:hypothetical protein